MPVRDALPAPPDPSLVVVAGGDVNLGRDVGQRLLEDPTYDPFAGVTPVIRQADLAFANLESPLSDQHGETRHPRRPLVFTGPPGGARALARSGFDLVSIANNHIWDYGRGGFVETLAHLGRAHVGIVGGSARPRRSMEPAVVRWRGWSLAVFAVTEVWNPGPFRDHEGSDHVAWADVERVVPAIQRAVARHDVVLVSYHGGKEYSPHPAMEPMEFSRAVMEAGAEAFLGHHPHVPQGIRWFTGRPVFYSLGNLVFGRHRDHAWTGRSFIARLTFAREKAPAVELCPVLIEGGEPRLLEPEEFSTAGRVFSRHLSRLSHSAHVGGASIGDPGEEGCFPVGPPR